ncbi:MAG: sulfatase [Planctomycetes bacterium]|nr:sulfatase [Planctomycetota bacterium]
MFGLALACAAIGAACSCESEKKPERKPAKTTARNVVIVLIDTLRADKLGCYGNTLGLTPNIDQIASEGFRFDQAFSHAPWTLPATASLLTSSYPQQHGAGQKRKGSTSNFDFTGLAPDVRTIAECYYDQGFDTHAIVNVLFLAPKKFGIDRGFSSFDFKAQDKTQTDHRRATDVTDLAISWIKHHQESSDRPFFLLVHYFDPHLKYDPPAEFRKRFALPQDQQPDPTLFGSESDMINFRNGVLPASQIPIKRLEALYNGEVAYTDEQVGRLWNEIKKMGIGDRTVMALTADHGEEFFDHDGFEHGHTLYDEMIRVPLVLWGPEAVKPGMSKTAVGHVDVANVVRAV